MPHFVKFPRTHHLLDTGGAAVTRDDLVCDAAAVARFCNGTTRVCVQEKVDGANLGFSLDDTWTIRAQNRCGVCFCIFRVTLSISTFSVSSTLFFAFCYFYSL